ncbi:MAG: acyl-ACP--UDP-N-acetylglucosamine O-acyltransferase [Elusimicrobia bacterium]|nr:acyl-ACP--UDP-N-acetylglucosamine O-acyltransferase [Elusimicrobiota bacterium]
MIHATAIIHPTAKLANTVDIGPYAVIGENSIIGAGTSIGAHAIVEFAEIGTNCKIFSHAAVGTAPQDLKYKNESTKIIIGNNCMIREFTTLNRGTSATGKTVIGSDCLFMAYSHVAHDCHIGNGVVIANVGTIAGHVEIGDGAFMGGIVAIHQFTRIGKLAMLAGGSMISQDILPFCQAQGNRARLVGLNLVGMKRRGFSKEIMEEIKSAYRTLFLSGIQMEEALDQIDETSPCVEVKEMLDFVHASKRGIARPSRKEQEEEI